MASIALPASTIELDLAAGEDRPPGADRRADIDTKQEWMARVLAEVDCQGLLVLDQANLAWLTSGAVARGILDPGEMPALFIMPSQRWLLCANHESQRMFDEELDGMG